MIKEKNVINNSDLATIFVCFVFFISKLLTIHIKRDESHSKDNNITKYEYNIKKNCDPGIYLRHLTNIWL